MRPLKKVFAKGYVSKTVDVFVKVWKNPDYSNYEQMQWFRDVLLEYFNTIEKDDFLLSCEKKFLNAIDINVIKDLKDSHSKPYLRKSNEGSEISFDEFYLLAKQRRSVRWFLDKPVPREFIDKAILAANQSPSACNGNHFSIELLMIPIC